MKRLLIQACSGRKNESSKPIRAVETYDGVAYRVIKKFLRENPAQSKNLEIIILSAEYGLISGETKIVNYDRRINRERAESLKTQTFDFWQSLRSGIKFDDIFVNVGRDYAPALELISFPAGVQFGSGGIGFRNGQLKAWLNTKNNKGQLQKI